MKKIPESVQKKLVEKGIAVISEIEFAALSLKSSYDRVTGSNGKTTTTMLTYHLLKSAGLNIGLGKHLKEFCLQSC
jgi:UDP-N-acetylmuramoylalanine--D-glutamate ligase